MLRVVGRFTALSVLILLITCWLYAGLLAWRTEQIPDIDSSDVNSDKAVVLSSMSTWLGLAQSTLQQARRLLLQSQHPGEQVENLLLQALRDRPLYAPAWLEYAELARQRGNLAEAVRYLDYARALWPQRPLFLWRVAMLLISLEQHQAALATLASYWIAAPNNGLAVIALVRRLEPDSQIWVNFLLSCAEKRADNPSSYYRQLFDVAQRLHDIALAHTIWERLPEAAQGEQALLDVYLDLLLQENDLTKATAVWQQFSGSSETPHNGGFERVLHNSGLGWRYRQQAGYRIKRDSLEQYTGDYSLLVDFTGTKNLNFADLRQYMVVQPDQMYRLEGYWRGAGITTRSGVYLEVLGFQQQPEGSKSALSLAALEPRWGSWGWQHFEMKLNIPADVGLLEIRLRRRATRALDNLIAGKIWLDDLVLTPHAETP